VLVRRVRARRGELGEAILARVSAVGVGLATTGDRGYASGLRAALVAAVDYALASIEAGVCVGRVPEAVRAQARRAARAGVGLDTVLRRYVAGYALLEEAIFERQADGEDDQSVDSAALREALQIASLVVERLIGEVGEAYRAEVRALPRRAACSPPPESGGRERNGGTAARRDSEDRSAPGDVVASMRRERILRAFVELAQHGLAETSVGLVVARARVSRRTFYELFPCGLGDCLMGVLDQAAQRATALATGQLEQAGSWQEGVRGALAALLFFFDREPELARVCFVQALAGGREVVERREAAVGAFRELIVAYVRRESGQDIDPLAAEGAIASVMGILYTRLLAAEQAPLLGLLGPLTGLIAAPHLHPEDAHAEALRAERFAHAIQHGRAPGWASLPGAGEQSGQGLTGLPSSLANPGARRARQCLLYIAEQSRLGRHLSNREVAAGIGVRSKGQISRLLSRLRAEDLLVKRSVGVGAPNTWSLTADGEMAARTLADM
jgi:AcrR family transcriptional regulator